MKGAATTSVTITSAANANGFGNDVCMVFTGTAADDIEFSSAAPSANNWNLVDIFEGGGDAAVAAGSSKAAVYWDTLINTNAGTSDAWSMYPKDTGDGPTEAYTYRFRSPPAGVRAGSVTKGYIQPKYCIRLSAAGSIDVTFSRAE